MNEEEQITVSLNDLRVIVSALGNFVWIYTEDDEYRGLDDEQEAALDRMRAVLDALETDQPV